MGDLGKEDNDKGLGGKNSFRYSTNYHSEKAERKNTPYYYPHLNENIQFILNHFQEPLFPRAISTKSTAGSQVQVNSINEMYKKFEKSNFIDCRINAFPSTEKPVPNFIFIDLDNTVKNISLYKISEITLSNIKKRLAGTPTVLWSGNGYHIYLPFDCPTSLNMINELKEFENVDNRFLRFEKDFLSNGYADKANYPSLKSCLLRVPGSLNSKCITKGLSEEESKVKILQLWDGQRPPLKYMIGTFYAYLKSEKMKEEQRLQSNYSNHDNQGSREITWIEKLLETPLRDHRKICLWHILIPYLVNIKRVQQSEIYQILGRWLDECNKERKIGFNIKYTIKSDLKNVEDFLPISKDNLKKKYPDLYEMIKD